MSSTRYQRASTLGASLALLAWAAAPASANDPNSYRCAFENGSVAIYEGGAFKSEKLTAMTVEIGDIDPEKQTARLTGPGGNKQIRVVRAVNALHFLEVASEGFLNVTTVYDRDDAKAAHPAVHSRHFGILGQPLVSQYTGFCQSK